MVGWLVGMLLISIQFKSRGRKKLGLARQVLLQTLQPGRRLQDVKIKLIIK